MMKKYFYVFGGVVLLFLSAGNSICAAGQLDKQIARVLLVTGIDHPAHDWGQTAPALADVLRKDGRLKVEVVNDPNFLSSSKLHDYDVVVLHFMNWERQLPGAEAGENLAKFVRGGKGLVLTHFACGAFGGWPEFRNLAGRVWDAQKRPHDPYGSFKVEIKDANHPVMKGVGSFEIEDELYTCLVGERKVDILATARSKVDGVEYPMAFAFDYGKGRVFHCVLGHDVKSITNRGAAEIFRRACAWAAGLNPAQTKKVVFIAGEKTHGEGEHAHEDGVWLLKNCLDNSQNVTGIESEVVLDGWPSDANMLDIADTIVIFSDGWEDHPIAKPERVKKFRELMAKKKGLVCLHFAVAPPRNEEDETIFLKWLGGFYKDGYSQNPYNEPLVSPASPGHPICRGVKSFSARDEFYFKLKFDEKNKGVTAILTAPLPADNPKSEILAWAFQRDDGGRSFGFTGGHYHKNWEVESLRKTVLNAILWTANIDVPSDGVKSTVKTQIKE